MSPLGKYNTLYFTIDTTHMTSADAGGPSLNIAVHKSPAHLRRLLTLLKQQGPIDSFISVRLSS